MVALVEFNPWRARRRTDRFVMRSAFGKPTLETGDCVAIAEKLWPGGVIEINCCKSHCRCSPSSQVGTLDQHRREPRRRPAYSHTIEGKSSDESHPLPSRQHDNTANHFCLLPFAFPASFAIRPYGSAHKADTIAKNRKITSQNAPFGWHAHCHFNKCIDLSSKEEEEMNRIKKSALAALAAILLVSSFAFAQGPIQKRIDYT